MARVQWKVARILGVITISIFLYLLFRVKNYPYKATVLLRNAHPNDVWEFVADFSNMKVLNPTIVDFKLINESGNYGHWKYSIEYEEHLSHWPYLTNHARASFSINSNTQKDRFFINSVHVTCFLGNYLCLNSQSEFIFTHGNSKGTFCEEKITYQCPAIFSTFCQREVEYQRRAIMNNLKNHFQY